MLNAFHISDLHFTSEDSGQLRDAATASVRSILELADTLKGDGTLGPNVCVFITGDIVQRGASVNGSGKSDFDAVQKALMEPLLELLSIGPDRVFLVPGNHDLDRNAVEQTDWQVNGQLAASAICEADIDKDLRKKLKGYFEFVEKHGYRSVTTAQPRVAFYDCDGQQVVCLNGLAGAYSRKGNDDKGELFVLGSELAGSFSAIERNAVVLTHHPLSWFADRCGNDLKEFLSSKHCRLFTGHVHDRGVDRTETPKGAFVTVLAGAAAAPDVNVPYQVAVAWLPPSDSVAVRHYELDVRSGGFPVTPVAETNVAPKTSENFFRRTEAFFDPEILNAAIATAQQMCEAELKAASGQTLATYVPPDVSRFPGDVFSGRRIPIAELEADPKNRVLSGDELSGKSALVHWLSARENGVGRTDGPKLSTVVDYRIIEAGQNIRDTLVRRLAGFGLTAAQAEYVLSIGKLELFFDNFSPHDSNALANFQSFFAERPRLRWTVATRGSARYMPSQAPTAFSRDGLTYYQLVETTMPTVLRMIENHEQGKSADSPRAIVDKVFRSINNLRAPRTIFYVQSMVDVFLSNSSVEPLNRYLLIENLLSDRIRGAHREMLPNQPVDMEMLETFIGQIAHLLMKRSDAYLSKGDFYQLVEDFVDRKGIQKKRFDADTILKILNFSFVLREYEPGFGFMMPSIEDYFLAKHMSRDEDFRSLVMSADGLLAYPTVAELYIAQNPSDRPRIEGVLALLDAFQAEVAPFVAEIRESAVATIASAHPGGSLQLQDGIVERLGKLENEEDGTALRFEDPQPIGRTKRIRFANEERGAVFLQLGASILGITRTLDQDERIQIFGRLRGVLLTTIHSLPMIAHHLAEGGEITLRGTSLKADYVGELAVPEDRFYIILRSMIFNLFRNFATWSGSPTFFKAAVRLRAEEEDELVRSALFTQNIEADLADALEFIPAISTGVNSLILKDILVNTYLDAMTLVPLERADEARAIQRLVEVTLELHPAKSKDEAAILKHKDQLGKHFNERIGLNRYLGRLGSARR